MTEIRKTSASILGDLSTQFLVKTQEGGGILDIPDQGLLELYPAGYTKQNPDGTHRQLLYKNLWEIAVECKTEKENFPFKDIEHKITFEPEPNNDYDPNAILINIDLIYTRKNLTRIVYKTNMGYIPKRINKQILANLNIINNTKILKVKANFHKKYYSAKIVIGYGPATLGPLSSTDVLRFSGLLDEQ